MVQEELFETASGKFPDDTFPDLEEIIRKNLVYGDAYTSKKGKDEKGNSFQGMPVVYFIHPSSIPFTPDSMYL